MAAHTLPQQQSHIPSFDVMDMLSQHVPLLWFVDVAFPDDLARFTEQLSRAESLR